MTDETQQPSVLSMRQEDLDELLTRAAERGAERCLAHLGLENGHAARDIRELRDLLEAWRDARHTAWQTVIKVATTGMRPTSSGIRPNLMMSAGSTSPNTSDRLRDSLLLTVAPKPMPEASVRFSITFSSPANAPPQMNKMLVVSICKKS